MVTYHIATVNLWHCFLLVVLFDCSAFCSYETAGDQADVAEFQSALDGIRKKHTLHEDKPPQSSDDKEKWGYRVDNG